MADRFDEADRAARERRLEDAAAIWQELAEEGYAEAQYHLASLHRIGRGVERDPAAAVQWFEKAASAGNWDAQYSLGRMYENGWGVEPNRDEAIRWYREAALRGHAFARAKLVEAGESPARPPAATLASFDFGGGDFAADPEPAVGESEPEGGNAEMLAPVSTGSAGDESLAADETPDVEEEIPICWAARGGQVGTALVLLDNGVDPSTRCADEQPLLLVVAEEGADRLVRPLVRRGAAVDERSSLGNTALMLAADRGHLEVARVLVALGADVNVPGPGQHTALMRAAASGHGEIVRLLLENGATASARSESGDTATSLAREAGWSDVVADLDAHSRPGVGMIGSF